MQKTTTAIIDVGSNTIRMNLYTIEQARASLMISTKASAGLASFISSDHMEPGGMDRLISVLAEFQTIAKSLHIDSIHVFATQSLRGIDNASDVIKQVETRTGLKITLLSGSEEARLSFLGSQAGKLADQGVFCDIGGGSSEVVVFASDQIEQAESLPVGSLNLYNRFVVSLIPTPDERKAMEQEIQKLLKQDLPHPKPLERAVMFASGGSARSAKALLVQLGRMKAGDIFIDAGQLGTLLDFLQKDPDQSIKMILKLSPDRVHTLFGGMLILYALCQWFGCCKIRVCPNGVREGFLNEKVLSIIHEE